MCYYPNVSISQLWSKNPLPSSGSNAGAAGTSSAAISPEEKIGQGDSPTELRFQT